MVDESPKKELAVSLSFSIPLSLANWLESHMAATDRNKSEVVKDALELLQAKAESEKAMVAA